jgi:hypothetical protein
MNILIGGSRTILDSAEVLKAIRDAYKSWNEKMEPDTDIIMSGMAPGPDTAAVTILENCGFTIEKFPAKWTQFGKRAGSLRNQEMVNKADRAIFIWDGESRGTSNCIRMMERRVATEPAKYKMYIHKIAKSEPLAV